MLARVIRRHWHALVRDVMALGYRAKDIFTELTLPEVVSIVLGAPPGSSIRYFLDDGWSREAHLLANQLEASQGLATLEKPLDRPGMDDREQQRSTFFQTDAMTWEEMDEMNAKRYTAPQGTNRVRTL